MSTMTMREQRGELTWTATRRELPAGVVKSGRTWTRPERRSGCRPISWSKLGLALLVLGLMLCQLGRHEAEANPLNRRILKRSLMRYCSTSLTDAMYLLCGDRGFNGPITDSGEFVRSDPSPKGLVDECCRNSCTIEQMEAYCKPRKPKN